MIITIGGYHGSGKTTVGKVIAEKLGYQFLSTGDVRGEIALKHGMTMNELNKIGEKESWPHQEIDDYIKELGQTSDNLVIDSWLAFHFIPQALKIFFNVDPYVGASRVFNQKQADAESRKDETKTKSIEETLKDIEAKSTSWATGIERLYGIKPFAEEHYDHILDTSQKSPELIIEQVMELINSRLP